MSQLSKIKRKLQGQSFIGETFERQDLRSMSSYGSKWEKCKFIECKMSLADMSVSSFIECEFQDCDMMLSGWARTQIRRSVFLSCNLEQANFSGGVLEDVHFTECRLCYSTFADATIRKVKFSFANLHGADLRYIECHDADYQHAVLWGAAIQANCNFFQATFDERSIGLFAALLARVYPDGKTKEVLADLAKDHTKTVERLMAG